MLGSPAGPGGSTQRGLWPLAPAPAPPNTAFTSDGFSKCGVYSLFPGGPNFGSALYSHARTIGQFTSGQFEQTTGNPFHHKDSFFSSTAGYTFGAPTPPPGSPYSPVPVTQLELLAKGFNSNIIIHQQQAPQSLSDFPPSPKKLIPNTSEVGLVKNRCDEKCCNVKPAAQKNSCACQPHLGSPSSVKKGGATSAGYSTFGTENGCSRTNPIDWGCAGGVNVKKEPGSNSTPCQVAEISTSASPVIKLEITSPRTSGDYHHHQHQQQVTGLLDCGGGNSGNNANHIPIGIAVARQRFHQQHQQEMVGSPSLPPMGLLTTVNASAQQAAQVKEVARLSEMESSTSGGGMAALSNTTGGVSVGGPLGGGVSTGAPPMGGTLLQCQTDDRTPSLVGWPMGGGANHHSTSTLTTPTTLWQYPAPVPMEPMVPLPVPMPPHCGFQLVRDPTTGGLLLLPTATGLEPLQQAVVWPSYHHQPSSVLLPPLPPPPLQLLSSASTSDYLSSSTTLHQHTQTHSTRLVALTTDNKRKIPMPIPATTLIKIETDATLDQTKTLQAVSTIASNTGTVFTDQSMTPLVTTHVIYQHPATNLVLSQQQPSETATMCRSQATSPVATCLTPPPETSNCTIPEESQSEPATPATLLASSGTTTVQDASNQTDTPICSEDDNTVQTVHDIVMNKHLEENAELQQNEVSDDVLAKEDLNSSASIVRNNLSLNLNISSDVDNNINSVDNEDDTPVPEFSVVPPCHQVVPKTLVDSPPVAAVPFVEQSFGTAEQVQEVSSHQISEETPDNIQNGPPGPGILVEKPDLVLTTQSATPPQEIAQTTEKQPDLSGLELLSNSIVEFESFRSNCGVISTVPPTTTSTVLPPTTTVVIVDEDDKEECDNEVIVRRSPVPQSDLIGSADVAANAPASENNDATSQTTLGGLDLLCALAEQRILEENVEKLHHKEKHSREHKKRKSKRHSADEPRRKKSKSDEREHHRKRHRSASESSSRKAKKHHEYFVEILDANDPSSNNTKNTTTKECHCNKDDLSYCRTYKTPESEEEVRKFIASKTHHHHHQTGCCKNGDWPCMNEMELDMRMKLADLQRQYREKQKELSKLKPKNGHGSNNNSKHAQRKLSRKRSRGSLSPPPPLLVDSRTDGDCRQSPAVLGVDTSAIDNTDSQDEGCTLSPPILCQETTTKKTPKLEAIKQSDRIINDYKKDLMRQRSLLEECSPDRTSNSSSKKRKVGRPKKLSSPSGFHQSTETIVAKKPKNSIVGYLLAAKEKYQLQNKPYLDSPLRYVEDSNSNNKVVTTTTMTHRTKKNKNNNNVIEEIKSCKIRPKLKAEPTVKSYAEDEDQWEETQEEEEEDEEEEENCISEGDEEVAEEEPSLLETSKISDVANNDSDEEEDVQSESEVEDEEEEEEEEVEEEEEEEENPPTLAHQSQAEKQETEISPPKAEIEETSQEVEKQGIPQEEEQEAEPKVTDDRCILTAEHLEVDKLRVLTAMGGLFYAGHLNAVQPPDVYSITLDGERGNKPHIMSREEILRDAIVEISPKSTEELASGTRLCAYWSQQYRCLYPGSVAEPGTPDPALDAKFVAVEFDDGDSGRIALEDIRLLPPDYPIMEYDPNPLQSLSKRKRRTSNSLSTEERKSQPSQATSSVVPPVPSNSTPKTSLDVSTASAKNPGKKNTTVTTNTGGQQQHKAERKRLKKKRKNKLKQKLLSQKYSDANMKKKKRKHKCTGDSCKHKKHHKKHRKHRNKHHAKLATLNEEETNTSTSTGVEEEDLENTPPSSTARNCGGGVSNNSALLPTVREETELDLDMAENEEECAADLENSSRIDDEEDDRDVEELLEEDSVSDDVSVTSDFNDDSGPPGNPEDEVTMDDILEATQTKKTKKIRDRQESCESRSKMSAFLPARQLWNWRGSGYKRPGAKGRGRKQFYKQIQRGKEIIEVGDSAVFLSTGRPDRPYIGKIESMWEHNNTMVVKVKWFYHPEETVEEPNLQYPGALFQSPHIDENDVQTIAHKCEVLSLSDYRCRLGDDPERYAKIYENNDLYYQAGYYDPTTQTLSMEANVPRASSK